MKGREIGSKGYKGPAATEEDEALARRRYVEYIHMTKDLEPFSYSPEDLIPLLPMEGATMWPCGDTRFEHAMTGKCKNLDDPSNRCGALMRTGKPCGRQPGHADQHMSMESIVKSRATTRARRKRVREMEGRNSKA